MLSSSSSSLLFSRRRRRSLQTGGDEADADCGRWVSRFLEMEIGCSSDRDCSRKYYLYIPCTMEGMEDEILPVMFVLHCYGCTFDTMKHWKIEAERYGFVLVIPLGLQKAFNAKVCCGYPLEENIDDKAFLQEIQNQLQQQYGPNRFSTEAQYAVGWSNGGYLVTYAAELFRAVAPIAGFQYDDIDKLSPNHPVGLFLHHALDDGNVQVTGCCTDATMPRCCCGITEASPDTCLGAEGFVQQFAQAINIPNGCSETITWQEIVIEGITCYTAVSTSTTTTEEDCQLQRNTTYCIHPTGHHFASPSHENAFTMRNAIMDFFVRDICSISDSPSTWDAEKLQCSSCATKRTRYCLPNNDPNAGVEEETTAAATATSATSSSPSPPNEWNAVIIPFLLVLILSGFGFVGFQRYKTNKYKYSGFQVVSQSPTTTTTTTIQVADIY